MNNLHSQQMWELARMHQEDLRMAAHREYLAKSVRKASVNWWRRLLNRYTQKPTLVLKPQATPELS